MRLWSKLVPAYVEAESTDGRNVRKFMTDNDEAACTGDDADADDDKGHSDNFMDSFRSFLKERGVVLD